jgi:hypothetical protein
MHAMDRNLALASTPLRRGLCLRRLDARCKFALDFWVIVIRQATMATLIDVVILAWFSLSLNEQVMTQQELICPGSGKSAGNAEAVAGKPVIGIDPVAERRAHAPRIAEPRATT